ncbi:hypothetical protein SEVIR_1G066700v4 [Setaria viridis]|uniref:Proline-rich protein PRCC n=1 Tax=Setaria viridis TaxID=4556 RepID=A0A4U6W797_SETVI|nr:proline-rich protein PRCC isoform X1 [Setaria viridis]TKW37725.1 hypothetical protein SEVIR_1G066700v2 [Setaria viridis]
MDSLLASYASSDDEADEAPPAPAPAAARGGEAGAKPPTASSGGGGGIFSSLPQPKSAALFSSLPPPKSAPAPSATRDGEAAGKPPTSSSAGGGIFSSLPQPKSAALFSSLPAPKSTPAPVPAAVPTSSSIPAPKSSTGKPKRVVQYRPQPIRQPTGDSSDDEEDDAKKRRASAAEARLPPVSAGSGPVSSFLPPPKHSLGLGSGLGAGARRSAIDTAAPERSNLGAPVPSGSIANTGAPEKPDVASDDDDSEDSGSEEDMPVPEQLEEGQEEQQGLEAAAGEQQQQGYYAAAGSTSGYEAYAWDPNYYAQYGANYGWDPSANPNYVAGAQYAASGGEQSGGYVHSHGGEHGGGYEYVAAAPYGVDYTGGCVHEVAAPTQEPVLPPEMGRIGGKRGRNDMPAQILEVDQAELMKNRPKQDTSKLTGLAFGPSYQPAPSAKGKPSKLHKRKHQIGSLYFDMKSKEMELAERRSKGILTKAETQAKYGW